MSGNIRRGLAGGHGRTALAREGDMLAGRAGWLARPSATAPEPWRTDRRGDDVRLDEVENVAI